MKRKATDGGVKMKALVLWSFVMEGLSLASTRCCASAAFGTRMPPPAFQTGRFITNRYVAAVSRETSMAAAANETFLDDESNNNINTYRTTLPAGVFDVASWNEYEATIRTVMDKGRMVKRKDRAEDVSRAIDYLLDKNRTILPLPTLLSDAQTISSLQPSLSADASRECMAQQKQQFLQVTNLTEAQHDLAMRILTYLGDHCAKSRTPVPLVVAWHKIQEAGMVPRENCFSTYMYALSLDNDAAASGGCSDAATRSASAETDTAMCTAQVATFHDLFYEPNEKTITLRIKSMIVNRDAAGAEELLKSSPTKGGEWKKLRTFGPVIELYCNQGDMASSLRLYRQMQEQTRVHFEPDTYALLIGALAEQGCFRNDAPPIPGLQELGFRETSGPGLFDELATEMAADVLELNNASARVLYNGFVKGFLPDDSSIQHNGTPPTVVADAQEIPVDNNPVGGNNLAIGRVSLDDRTALCPKTNAKLQLFQLDDAQRQSVHDTLVDMAGIQYEKFMGELEARFKQRMHEHEGKEFAIRELLRFSDWLNEREGEPFTAIVDGPNVAYFGHGTIHYSQVLCVMKQLELMNENPLVVMPKKYTTHKFRVNYGSTQELSDRDVAALNELNETGKLYTVPSKCLDDYYWMLASASNQSTACDQEDMHVPVSDSDGRFPGLRPMLVTNDQMRDHRWDLLEPRLFRRWCSCHIVNYNITQLADDEWEERDVNFCAADFFSNEIQGNPSLDSHGHAISRVAWHFPVKEWNEHDRLCIRLPSS